MSLMDDFVNGVLGSYLMMIELLGKMPRGSRIATLLSLVDYVAGLEGKTGSEFIREYRPLIDETSEEFGVMGEKE